MDGIQSRLWIFEGKDYFGWDLSGMVELRGIVSKFHLAKVRRFTQCHHQNHHYQRHLSSALYICLVVFYFFLLIFPHLSTGTRLDLHNVVMESFHLVLTFGRCSTRSRWVSSMYFTVCNAGCLLKHRLSGNRVIGRMFLSSEHLKNVQASLFSARQASDNE